jgi:rare lipoprotein A
MRIGITILSLLIALSPAVAKSTPIRVPSSGEASWYGEAHRGKLMANGKKFDPNKLTAASWFYPLGTKVKVVHRVPGKPARSVLVTITDRGPARELVRDGRIIDLTHAAFKRLGNPDVGLIPVVLKRVQ